MKKFLSKLVAIGACVALCLLCVSCGPSAADEKYRSLNQSLTIFLSDGGLQTYLYSKDVLGSQMSTTTASVTPQILQSKEKEFKSAYDKINNSAQTDSKK